MLTIKLVQIGTPSRDSIVYSGYVLLVKSPMHIKYNWPNNSLCFCEATIIISTIQLGPRESKRLACARIFLSTVPYHAPQNRILAVEGWQSQLLRFHYQPKQKWKRCIWGYIHCVKYHTCVDNSRTPLKYLPPKQIKYISST